MCQKKTKWIRKEGKILSHTRERIYCFICCILFLFCGFLFYLFFNQTAYISRFVLGLFPSSFFSGTQISSGRFYVLAVSFGADFFWAVALPFAVQGIFLLRGRRQLLLLFCTAFGVLVEVFQAIGVIHGTFDLLDILIYFIGTVSAVGILCLFSKKGKV